MDAKAKEWYDRSDEERNQYLKDSADEYKDRKKQVARRLKRPTVEKMRVLDPISGELLNLTTQEASDLLQKYQNDESEKRRQSNEQKNNNFIQLQKGTAPEMIAQIVAVSPVAVQVLMFFFKNMSKDGVLAVSQQTIADTIGKSRQAVNQAVKVLEEYHAVARGKIGGSSVVYIVNPDIAWQQTSVKKKIMYMNGVMMLSKSENERIFEEFEKLQSAKLTSLSIKTGNVKVARNQNAPVEQMTVEDFDEFDEFEDDDNLPPGETPPEDY